MIATLAKCGMGLLLVASVPVGGDSETWAQWGLAGIVVAYTLWRDNSRECRMSAALEEHEEWVRTTMLGAIKHNTAAMEKMIARLDRED